MTATAQQRAFPVKVAAVPQPFGQTLRDYQRTVRAGNVL